MTKLPDAGTGVQFLTIADERDGQRIDNFLISQLHDIPKSRIYRLLRKGEIRVNKKRTKPTYRVQEGDIVRLPPMQRSTPRSQPSRISSDLAGKLRQAIVWESDELLVLNKPSGFAVHGGSGVNLGVIEALRLLYPEQKSLELVHRLDRETSGCLLVAKKRAALRHLHTELRNGAVDKTYTTLVAGRWPGWVRQVDAPLLRNELVSGERMVEVNAQGKQACTHFRVQNVYAECTLLRVKPQTGRTHQIRVHARHIGCPIAGDEKYGSREFNRSLRKLGLKRLFLHAQSLSFSLPGVAQPVEVTAQLPADLQLLLDGLAGIDR